MIHTAPVIPTPPKAPPLPVFKGPTGGGGGITAEALLKAKAGLKQVGDKPFTPPKKPQKVLPGAKASAVPLGVRVIVNAVGNPFVPGVKIARPCPGFGAQLFYQPAVNYNLGFVMQKIAEGAINTKHGNYNTRYRNRGGELPEASNPMDRYGIDYFEYGWLDTIAKPQWANWGTGAGMRAPKAVCERLSGFLETDNGQIDVSRLIVADSGEIFYTPDHYNTFFRYSQVTGMWTQYLSPFARYGDDAWDELVYEVA